MSRQAWEKLASPFAENVCDVASIDDGDMIGDILSKHGFNRQKGFAVDVGCGVGSFLNKHAWRFELALGLDQIHEFVEQAKEKCKRSKNIWWACDDMESAARSLDGLFDIAVSLNVITSPSGKRRRNQWKAISSMLNSSGKLLVAVPSLESDTYVRRISASQHRNKGRVRSDGIVERRQGVMQKFYTEVELKRQLRSLGWLSAECTRLRYPWRYEGIDPRHVQGKAQPWDWLCLAFNEKAAHTMPLQEQKISLSPKSGEKRGDLARFSGSRRVRAGL